MPNPGQLKALKENSPENGRAHANCPAFATVWVANPGQLKEKRPETPPSKRKSGTPTPPLFIAAVQTANRVAIDPLCHHDRVPLLNRTLPIAVFDSGVGGLTVLHECLVWLPHEDFVYLGDTARFPYGGRDPDQLREMAVEIGSYLVEEERAKLVVVACNSAAAAGLPRIAEATGIAVVGVIAPAARQAVRATSNKRVGLLATPATVASGAYERAIQAEDPEVQLHSIPCPKLAPLIQEGGALDPSVIDIVDEYCEPLHAAEVDTVILGCTHYPIVRSVLQRALGRDVTLVSSGQAIAVPEVTSVTPGPSRRCRSARTNG